MSFTVEWSLLSNPVPIDAAARIAGVDHQYIKDLLADGTLGPVTDAANSLSLYNLASLFVLVDANRKKIHRDKIYQVLPAVAGGAFIQLQLLEVTGGRCVHRRGTPKLIHQLWTMLRSPAAKELLEEKLPGGPVLTHRYAWFSDSDYFTGDNLSSIQGSLDSWKIIDAFEIASQMKRGLPGQLFAGNIE